MEGSTEKKVEQIECRNFLDLWSPVLMERFQVMRTDNSTSSRRTDGYHFMRDASDTGNWRQRVFIFNTCGVALSSNGYMIYVYMK